MCYHTIEVQVPPPPLCSRHASTLTFYPPSFLPPLTYSPYPYTFPSPATMLNGSAPYVPSNTNSTTTYPFFDAPPYNTNTGSHAIPFFQHTFQNYPAFPPRCMPPESASLPNHSFPIPQAPQQPLPPPLLFPQLITPRPTYTNLPVIKCHPVIHAIYMYHTQPKRDPEQYPLQLPKVCPPYFGMAGQEGNVLVKLAYGLGPGWAGLDARCADCELERKFEYERSRSVAQMTMSTGDIMGTSIDSAEAKVINGDSKLKQSLSNLSIETLPAASSGRKTPLATQVKIARSGEVHSASCVERFIPAIKSQVAGEEKTVFKDEAGGHEESATQAEALGLDGPAIQLNPAEAVKNGLKILEHGVANTKLVNGHWVKKEI